MAYKALLTIEDLGEEYEDVHVHHCEFEFSQKIDVDTGHIRGHAVGGLIHITIDSTKHTPLLFWLIFHQVKDGSILFEGSSASGPTNLKKLEFQKAKCVEYKEVYDSSTGEAMRCHFSIWCEEISIGGTDYKVKWRDE